MSVMSTDIEAILLQFPTHAYINLYSTRLYMKKNCANTNGVNFGVKHSRFY